VTILSLRESHHSTASMINRNRRIVTDIAVQIPGFIAGRWAIDPNHSEVAFTVGHLVVSKVRGRFDAYSGTIVTDGALGHSSVEVTIDAASVNTHMPIRDNQVRSADFLDVEHFPDITFTSSTVRNEEGRYFVDGDLTIRATTLPVTLNVNVNGFSPDTFGATRSSFSAITKIDRTDFGVSFNAPIPGLDNAMLLSNEVVLTLDVEAVLQTGATAA
jgi:polyisoprenoid-binding protein YceI